MITDLVQFDSEIVREDKEVLAVQESLSFIESEATDLTIIDKETREAASAIRSQIKDIEKRLKGREEFFKRPAQDYVKKVTAFFKYFSDRIETADKILKKKQVEDFENQERARREAQAKIDAENEARRKEAEEEAKKNNTVPEPMPVEVMVAPTETMVRTDQGGTTFSKRWTFEVEIADQVPREYCEPVDTLIREAVRNGQRNIPGVKIFEETVTTRR